MVSKAECSGVIIFLLCLLKIENIRAQCTPNIGGNRQITEDSYKSSYPDGSTAKVECSAGYVPEISQASNLITCTAGKWTDPELQCTKKLCESLPEVLNGGYTYFPDTEKNYFGAKATPKCNEGYVLNGKPRYCTVQGWDGRAPICEEVNCEPPSSPEHGKPTELLKDVYRYRAVITYTCNEGYFFTGSDSISCMEDGKFQPPPQCQKLACEDLESDPNAIKIGRKPYKFGSLVRFECKPGYRLEGDNELKCVGTGWSSTPPKCLAQQATTTRKPTKATTPRPARPATEERVNPPHPTDPPPHNGALKKIAMGIGIPLGILALGVAVYFFIKRSSARGYSGNVAKNEDGQL